MAPGYSLGPDSACSAAGSSDAALRYDATRALDWIELESFQHAMTWDADGSSFEPRPLGPGPLAAVRSYPTPTGDGGIDGSMVRRGRSFAYDNALAAIAFLQVGEVRRAEAILNTLGALQGPDGAIGFSFNSREPAFYNRQYIRNGTVAWVGYAYAYHAWTTGAATYLPRANAAAGYLLAHRVETEGDPRQGLILGGHGLWDEAGNVFDAGFELQVAITEHQVDAWFFLDLLAHVTQHRPFTEAADALGQAMVERLWIEEQGRFAAAATPEGLSVSEALDAAGAWSAMFLLARGDRERAERAMAYVERRFSVSAGGLDGYRPYAGVFEDYPDVSWDESDLIFVEGTLSAAMAWQRLGDSGRARELLESGARMRCLTRGGLPYATREAKDFPMAQAAAPTLWFALAIQDRYGLDGGRPMWASPSGRR
jgi:hypothetical protein